MQEVKFTDPVTGVGFTSTQYEVLKNPSGSSSIVRTRAPSGSLAIRTNGVQEVIDNMTPEEVIEMEMDMNNEDGELFGGILDSDDVNPNPSLRGVSKTIASGASAFGVDIGGMSWRALRLPSAYTGAPPVSLTGLFNALKAFGVEGKSLRSGPFQEMINAKQWTDYLLNMDMADVGAELSADVSPEEKIAIFRFAKEWENDPSHSHFRNRLHNTKDVVSTDELAKGTIVYDLMTGMLPGPGIPSDRGTMRHDKMFRLAYDILASIRFRDYSYYTLNMLHADEGTQVYDDFMANYVPLEVDEVAVVSEIRESVGKQGMSYVMKTCNPEQDPAGALALMQNLEDAYEGGDTVLVRNILDALFSFPYNYKPKVGYTGLLSSSDSRARTANPLYVFIAGANRWVLDLDNVKPTGNYQKDPKSFDIPTGSRVYEIDHPNQREILGVWYKFDKDKKKWAFIPYGEYQAQKEGSQDKSNQRDGQRKRYGGGGGGSGKRKDSRGRGRDRGRHKSNPGKKGSRTGTLVLGRGKQYMIQILPKNKLKFSKGAKKKDGSYAGRDASEKHGAPGGNRKETRAGLTDAFGAQGQRVYQSMGKYQGSGTLEPYLLFVPTADFRKVNRVIDGKPVKSIVPKRKSNAAHQAAWNKFLEVYGVPKAAPTKGLPTRFVIHKPTRGTYYDGLRKRMKKGGKK